jgi:peptidoglycan/xylan/chitin deacetylase (PgdA/CDA1 family)
LFKSKVLGKRILGRVLHPFLPEPATPLAVLTYHSVAGGAPGSLSGERFRSQLAWLKQHSARIDVLSGDFAGWKSNRGPTSVLLTFDDGYLDNWEHARPILDEFGFKAHFFVTTGFVEGDRSTTRGFKNYRDLTPMNWDHVGALAEQGHTIGLHGHRHVNFRSLSRGEAVEEMRESIDMLWKRAGLQATTFAYPFGLPKHQRDDMASIIADLRIRVAYTSLHCRADIGTIARDQTYRSRVPRLRVDPGDSLEVFVEKVGGYWDFVAHVQRALAGNLRGRRA